MEDYPLVDGLGDEVTYKPKEYATREEWLLDASDLLQQAFVKRCNDREIILNGCGTRWVKDGREPSCCRPVEQNALRVSVGYPAHVRPSTRGKAVAECWLPEMVADGIPAVFISPELYDSYDVLEHLAHEVCHVLTSHESGHKRGSDFSQVCRAVGLEGPLTSTIASIELRDFFRYIIENHIGAYENVHSPLLPSTHIPTKTSLLKANCKLCGFTARVSRKWSKVIDHKCPYPPLKMPAGGAGSPPPPSDPDELDITPVEPPPSSGEGDGEGDADSKPDSGSDADSSSDSDGDRKEEEREGDAADKDASGAESGEAESSRDGIDAEECGACGAEVSATAENCSNCGAIFDDGDEATEEGKEVTYTAGVRPETKLDSVKHEKDMCPFVTGCDFCEGSI